MKFLPKFLTPKKLTFLLIAFCLLLFASIKPIHAFSTPNTTYQFQFEQAIRSPEMNLQSFVYETLKAICASGATTLGGCVTCPRGQENLSANTGLIGTVATLIASVYTYPSASGIDYLAYVGEKVGLVQPTYAQEGTVGFQKMRVFLPFWTAFRNIAYVFFILIFIFMGFAIMFRVKISPQAVITIQSALPKIILGLILVTFSYAIVGFMIDLMFVANNLIIVIFKNIEGIPQIVKDWFFVGTRIPVTGEFWTFLTLFSAGYPTFAATMIILVVSLGSIYILFQLIPATAAIAPFIGIGAVIVLLFVLLLFFIALIRVLWTLLKAYVMVVLSLIFAPFQILVGVLPGSNAIGSWFRNLLANLAVLPTVLVMALLSGYITLAAIFNFGNAVGGDLLGLILQYFRASGDPTPIITNIGDLLSGIVQNAPDPTGVAAAFVAMFILFFVSLAILLMTPKVSDMIQAFLAGKPFGYGAAIGEAMGPVRAPFVVVGGSAEAAARQAERAGTWASGIPYRIVSEISRKVGGGR